MTNKDIAKLLWLVKAHWPHFEIFGGDQFALQVGAWSDVLRDVALADARAAIANMATAGREFPPSAGQVRAEALSLRNPGVPAPDQAMAEVLSAVQRLGWTATMRGGPGLSWSHPAIGEAIDALGGWHEVCQSDNPEALRAHFTRAYASAAGRATREANTPPVVAELAEGLAKTFELEPPEDQPA